jgi:hypothetical protein
MRTNSRKKHKTKSHAKPQRRKEKREKEDEIHHRDTEGTEVGDFYGR